LKEAAAMSRAKKKKKRKKKTDKEGFPNNSRPRRNFRNYARTRKKQEQIPTKGARQKDKRGLSAEKTEKRQ